MSPQTPVHALPYPVATDPADVPYDLGNLAQRLDVVIPAGIVVPWREVGYAQITTPVTLPAASDGTAQGSAATVVALPSITYEAVPHVFEFYCHVQNGSATNGSRCALFDGATLMGWLSFSNANASNTVLACRRITPSAGAHTYSVRGFVNGGSNTAVVQAGTGVGQTHPPAYLRVYRLT